MASSVDQESDHHSRCHYFRIRALLLVQVPSASDSQELSAIAPAIQKDDHQVDDLQVRIGEKDLMRSRTSNPMIHIPATPCRTTRRMSNIANTPRWPDKRPLISQVVATTNGYCSIFTKKSNGIPYQLQGLDENRTNCLHGHHFFVEYFDFFAGSFAVIRRNNL